VIPPALSAAFVAAMEDILAVYGRPPDPRRPLICFDESGKALRRHTQPPQLAAPGLPAREDTTYARAGHANLFLACAPHLGWRGVQVTAQRTAVDFAHAIRAVLDGPFADAAGIVLVTDNLNTHTPAAFYQAFPAPEARRLLDRIEWHYTPVHGSWLNMAELELSALTRQCLRRRIPDRETVQHEVSAWAEARNQAGVRIDWRFGIDDARLTLAHCYPIPEQDISTMSEPSA
jgi:DDE superfamily endonuclease